MVLARVAASACEFSEFWVTGGDLVSKRRVVAFLVAEGWVAWY